MPEYRKYNTTLSAGTAGSDLIRISLWKADGSAYATSSDWTPASGDVKVSKDGGSQANIGTLPSYSNGSWEVTLSGTELTAKTVRVIIIDAAVQSFDVTVDTFGHSSAMYKSDFLPANMAADVQTWRSNTIGTPAFLSKRFIYISDGGDDTTGAGTISQPYASISKAIAVGGGGAAYGDTIVVLGGTVTGYVTGSGIPAGVRLQVNPTAVVSSAVKAGAGFRAFGGGTIINSTATSGESVLTLGDGSVVEDVNLCVEDYDPITSGYGITGSASTDRIIANGVRFKVRSGAGYTLSGLVGPTGTILRHCCIETDQGGTVTLTLGDGSVQQVVNRVKANTDQLAGQTVTAAAGVTFPASVGTSTLTAAGVWDYLTSAAATAGSFGKKIKDWVLGTDSKAMLSTDAQTGVTIPTVTTVTGLSTATIAAAVEAALLNEGDGAAVQQALVDKIAAANPDLSGLTLDAIAQTVWDYLTADATTANSLGKRIADNLDATISSRGTTGGQATINSNVLANATEIAATRSAAEGAYDVAGDIYTLAESIQAKTGNLPASPAAVGSAMTLTGDYDAAKTAATQTSVDAIATSLTTCTTAATHLETMIQLDGAVYRFTTNALEQAPAGGGAGGGSAPAVTFKQVEGVTIR